MGEYKILFIDEVEADIRRFQRYIHKKDIDKSFILEVSLPKNRLEDMLEFIYKNKFDAIVTDHKLHEENPDIEYDGIELVQKIQTKIPYYPLFVLTSFDDEAIIQGDDVNIIYVKGLMDKDGENKAHATFLDKVKNQIIHYRKKIEDAEDRILELIKKSETELLTAQEEDELIKLDNFIVSSLDKESMLPEQLKSHQNLEELHKMINNTDKLLERLQRLSNES